MGTRQVGRQWEKRAESFLRRHGLTVIDRNVHSRWGEIDLIMRDGDQLVFVEVRYRTSPNYGSAADSVTFAKQQRLMKSAEYYLQRHRHSANPCRFDVVSIQGGRKPEIQWIKNAFPN